MMFGSISLISVSQHVLFWREGIWRAHASHQCFANLYGYIKDVVDLETIVRVSVRS